MDLVSLISGAVLGLITGALAKWILPGRDPGGLVVTLLVGTAGAMLAGFVGRATGWYGPGRGPGLVAAVLGAVALLALYRLLRAALAKR